MQSRRQSLDADISVGELAGRASPRRAAEIHATHVFTTIEELDRICDAVEYALKSGVPA